MYEYDKFERVSRIFNGAAPSDVDPAVLEHELELGEIDAEFLLAQEEAERVHTRIGEQASSGYLSTTTESDIDTILGEENPSYLKTLEAMSEEQ